MISSLRVTSLIPQTIKSSVVRYGVVVVLRGEVAVTNDTNLHDINQTISSSRSFSRIRLQVTGNGIIGFKPSGNFTHYTHTTHTHSTSLCALFNTSPFIQVFASILITLQTPHHSMQCVRLQETTLVAVPSWLQMPLMQHVSSLVNLLNVLVYLLNVLVSTIFVYASL